MRPTMLLALLGLALAACASPSPWERTAPEAAMDLEETQPEPDE